MGAATIDPTTRDEARGFLERTLGPAAAQLEGAELVEAYVRRVEEGPQAVAERSVRPEHLKDEAHLRELYRMLGHDPELDPVYRELAQRELPPAMGGATGQGAAAFFINLPPQGTFEIDVPYFNRETERNDVPQQAVPWTGLGGSRMDQRISNVGILSNVRLVLDLTLVVAGAGTVTSTYGFPWNLPKKVTLNANGQTSLIQCEGMDLRARRQRLYRNPREAASISVATDVWAGGALATAMVGDPAPTTIVNGTYAITLVYDFPITHDPYSLTGALFAQSDANYLNWTIEPANSADVFVLAGGSTATITGNARPLLTFYDIPYVDTQQGRRVAIPDLRWLHGYIATNNPFANTGDVKTPFIKTSGQLIAFLAYLDNGGAAQLSPWTALDEIRMEYGANRRPRVYSPTTHLKEENTRQYNGLINPGYFVLDFEAENPARDVVYPQGVSELNIITKITAGTSLNANAHVHLVEETLFSGS